MTAVSSLTQPIAASFVTGMARLITGVRGNWQGSLPESRPRIYFANHRSHGDFVLVWTVLPRALRRQTRPVAAADYWGHGGITGFFGRGVFNAVLVDREAASRENDPIQAARRARRRQVADLFSRGHAQHDRGAAPAVQERALPDRHPAA